MSTEPEMIIVDEAGPALQEAQVLPTEEYVKLSLGHFTAYIEELIVTCIEDGTDAGEVIGRLCDMIGILLKNVTPYERKAMMTQIRWRIFNPQIKLPENNSVPVESNQNEIQKTAEGG